MSPRTFCLIVLSVPLASVAGFAQNGDNGFTAATYNIRYANPNDGEDIWDNRKQSVVNYVSELDIIGMQEVTAPQLKFLRDQLPDHDSYSMGRDDGERGGEHSPIFYRRGRFERLDQGTFWLSESPQTVGEKGWDAALPRICSWVVLRDKEHDERFLAASTHFDHRGRVARLESAKLTARLIPEVANDLPLILMGDFNCAPGSPPYEALAARFGVARALSSSPPQGPNGTFNGFDAIQKGRIIDHVFLDGFDVGEYRVEDPRTEQGRFASDHLPVRVRVSWRSRR